MSTSYENKPSWTIKYGFHIVAILDFFFKRLNHDFGQKLEFSSLVFLDKLGLEIMFADHPVRKKPS